MSREGEAPRLRPGQARARADFLRWLVVGMVAFFGVGTLMRNGLPLLATPQARAELGPIPFPLFVFDFTMGWLYLAEAAAISWRWRWAHPAAWLIAVAHALSASVLWLWYFAGHDVAREALFSGLVREGFWVLIALWLWQAVAPPRASTPPGPPTAPPAG